MQRFSFSLNAAWLTFLGVFGSTVVAQEPAPLIAIVISVADQKLAVLNAGGLLKKYPISTSKFGLGDEFGSYKTPLGRMRVCDKVGGDLGPGAVLKQRHATGEILAVNSPGRDPIVTRILWLEGQEPQNENARARGIYIHGTVEEKRIGEPVSYGCIRMRSKDVMEVFDAVPLDAVVTIMAEKLPRFPKYSPPKAPLLLASSAPSAPSGKTPPISASSADGAKAETSVRALATASAGVTPASGAPVTRMAGLAVAQASPGGNVLPAGTMSAPNVVLNSTASLALRGSILDAGLPQGPKIAAIAPLAETADPATASGNSTSVGLPSDSAFSLKGIARDLSVPRTSRAELPAPIASAPETAPEPAAPAPRLSFRHGAGENAATP